MDIEFVDVRIDSCFERADKQPDVIATTKEGQQYLIEFLFQYKIQHKTAIDYKNMKQISAIFEIYKTKCEQYFNEHGRNWRQMFKDYVNKRKAEKTQDKK